MLDQNPISYEDTLNKLSRIAQALYWLAEHQPDGGELLHLLGDDVMECLLALDDTEKG
ncbi:hypothetical protein [Pseudodesulfovibrio sediminis]|uniref:Uncharacterized protein n=1 Tax=Pseudodesulfovibrio sediminis TaxID=2810563 RepID=A0ABM7PA53_9BACT|nr:hypothetical protein [Pseudodesulfovibrio sediminis]BCS89986.1 hypothetical protein PSDVSF_32280 [Pseudodesulfovibrio sediminis]